MTKKDRADFNKLLKEWGGTTEKTPDNRKSPRVILSQSPLTGRWFWDLKVGSNRIASCIRPFNRRDSCLRSIRSVARAFKVALVVDESGGKRRRIQFPV